MNYRIRSVTVKTLSLLLLVLCLLPAFGKNLPEPTGRLVSDFAELLSPSENQQLENKLVAYNDSTSTQIAVVIETSLEGEEIFDYSFRLAEKWGIGQSGKDNGVLLFIAFQDRKLRIQTGSGAEGFLTDAMAKRIIENTIVPAFRNQQFFEGIDEATTIIMKLGTGEFTADDMMDTAGDVDSALDIIAFLIFIIIVIIIFGVIICKRTGKCKDSGGGYSGGGGYTSRRSSWGSGGFGSSSGGFSSGGGGFGGFGGGGFSGGGAGGGW